MPVLKLLPNSWFTKVQQLAIRGVPDIIGVVNGRFVGLELKNSRKEAEATKGRVRLQAHRLFQIRAGGGYGEFLYPENWDKVHAELSAISSMAPAAGASAPLATSPYPKAPKAPPASRLKRNRSSTA